MAFRIPFRYFTSFVFRHPNYRWDVSPFEVGYCRFDLVLKIFIHLFIYICKKHCFRHFSPLEFCLNTWTLVHLKSVRKSVRKHFTRLINAEFREETWLWSGNEWKLKVSLLWRCIPPHPQFSIYSINVIDLFRRTRLKSVPCFLSLLSPLVIG